MKMCHGNSCMSKEKKKQETIQKEDCKSNELSSKGKLKPHRNFTRIPRPGSAGNTVSITNRSFAARKSLSAVDMENFKKGKGRRSTSFEPSELSLSRHTSRENENLKNFYKIKNGSYDTIVENSRKHDQVALKFFAAVMLNAWRRTKDETEHFKQLAHRYDGDNFKSKHKLHAITKLHQQEKKCNEKLSTDFHNLSKQHNSMKQDYEKLKNSFAMLEESYKQINQKQIQQEDEVEGLNEVLSATNNQLFQSMANERQLEIQLSAQQKMNQELENHKNELLNQIADIKFESSENRIKLQSEIVTKNKELRKLKDQLVALEKLLMDMKMNELLLRDFEKSDVEQKKEISNLNEHIKDLETKLAESIGLKMKTMVSKVSVGCLDYAHLIMFCLLPSFPVMPLRNVDGFCNLIWHS